MEKMNPVKTKYEAVIEGFDGKFPVYSTERFPRKGNTKTGYGKNIPTRYMIKVDNRLYRLKMMIFSNSGTTYIKIRNQKRIVDLFD